MSKEELVELTIKIPKALFEFLADTEVNVEDHVTRMVVEAAYSDIESGLPSLIIEKYGLEPIFEKYGVLPQSTK